MTSREALQAAELQAQHEEFELEFAEDTGYLPWYPEDLDTRDYLAIVALIAIIHMEERALSEESEEYSTPQR